MALTPILSALIVNGNIDIEDQTVYGGANPLRSQVTVDFTVTRTLSNNQTINIPLTYDPSTVTTLSVTGLVDGWYVVTMTITDPITPGTPSTTANVFRYNDLDAERLEALSDFTCACCGEGIDYYLKLRMVEDGIIEYVAGNNWQDAQCLLEAIQTEITDACN